MQNEITHKPYIRSHCSQVAGDYYGLGYNSDIRIQGVGLWTDCLCPCGEWWVYCWVFLSSPKGCREAPGHPPVPGPCLWQEPVAWLFLPSAATLLSQTLASHPSSLGFKLGTWDSGYPHCLLSHLLGWVSCHNTLEDIGKAVWPVPGHLCLDLSG